MSEAYIENKLVKQLNGLGYEKVDVTCYDELKENFRRVFCRRYKKELIEAKGKAELSDNEFKTLLNYLEGKTEYECAKKLRSEYDFHLDSGKVIYVSFLNKLNNVLRIGKENIFQVTHQIRMRTRDHDEVKKNNRYDVILIINGLPLVDIELKTSGKHKLREAINQQSRYKDESFKGLFRYIQLLIAAPEVITRYAANYNSYIIKKDGKKIRQNLNPDLEFVWQDANNKHIPDIYSFTDSFLKKETLTKMLTDYFIVCNRDERMMVVRPHQFHAVEKAYNRLVKNFDNGYIFHSTGSGKTLEAFLLFKKAKENPNIKKVIFVTDRNDLDNQTIEEFNSFEKDFAEHEGNTKELLESLLDDNKKGIITTIQKLNNLKKEGYSKKLSKINNKKVVFIIDECHRTQSGTMHIDIFHNLFTNAIKIGFTGTPNIPDKENQDLEAATADLFKSKYGYLSCIHKYQMVDAINDKTILHIHTQFCGNPSIMNPNNFKKRSRYDAVAKDIMNKLEELIAVEEKNTNTITYPFSAILTVPRVEDIHPYMEALKKYNKKHFNIATMYSYQPNGRDECSVEGEETNKNKLEGYIQDYNTVMDTNFSLNTVDEYEKDIQNRVKRIHDGKPIHLVVVVNKLITGFDSKPTNTLFVDRDLKDMNLIQAYSRTIRVYNEYKDCGNVILYRDIEKEQNKAILKYSGAKDPNELTRPKYHTCLLWYKEAVEKLKDICETPASSLSLNGIEARKEFVRATSKVDKIYEALTKYPEMKIEEINGIMSSYEIKEYLTFSSEIFYNNYRKRKKINDDGEIDPNIICLKSNIIDAKFILDLVEANKPSEEILKKLEKSENIDELTKEYLKKFIKKECKKESKDIKKSFKNFIYKNFALKYHIDEEKSLELFIHAAENMKSVTRRNLFDLLDNPSQIEKIKDSKNALTEFGILNKLLESIK